jgi:hypothetical protein
MPRRAKEKLGILSRREDVGLDELDKAIRAARQRVAMIVHGAARNKKLIVSGRNREALYNKIGQVYGQLDNGLKDWGKDLVEKTVLDWRDEAIKDIAGQTGIDPSNEITKFSRRYAEDTFKLVHPDNSKSLVGVFTEKMATEDIRQLRQAAVDTFREGALSGDTMTEMAAKLQGKWDKAAGDMATNRFVDAAGRQWDNGRYLQMLVRTTVAKTSREGYFNVLTEHGDDLAVIANVDGEACPICQAWDGVIISITGASEKYPSYNQATAAGWGHPNCRCTAERVDETVDAANITDQAKADTPDFDQGKGESDGEYRRRVTEEMAAYSKDFEL